jgi:acyl-coenzyme A thioesterase PaaI-like protein
MTPASLRRILNVYPPFLFGGIKVEEISADWRYARVRLKLRWYNRNYVRTAFGGNLFSMTDPFWMIMVMESLGSDYIVWDKAAEIEFVAPGKEDVFAEFRLEAGVLDQLRREAAANRKVLRWFEVEIKTKSGELVARVRKQLYIRRTNNQPR